MNFKRGIFLFFIILGIVFIVYNLESTVSFAQNKVVELYYFYGKDCPYCAQMNQVLLGLQTEFPELRINKFEVQDDLKNQRLMNLLAGVYKVRIEGVPVIFIGESVIQGFDQGRVLRLREKIRLCSALTCVSPVEKLKKEVVKKTKPSFDWRKIIFPVLGLVIFSFFIFFLIRKKK